MAVKMQSVSLPTGLLQNTHTHTHTLWLMLFHWGYNVTETLPTVKHKCESTHSQACVITYTHTHTHYMQQSVCHMICWRNTCVFYIKGQNAFYMQSLSRKQTYISYVLHLHILHLCLDVEYTILNRQYLPYSIFDCHVLQTISVFVIVNLCNVSAYLYPTSCIKTQNEGNVM